MTTEEKFRAAVNIIRSLPKDGPYQPSHDMMLKFYGLYKQAVEGPCSEPKPAFYEVVKGYKWRAWSNLGNMTQDEAKNAYVDELKKIIETMAYTENVANFIDALGPFYEFIEVPVKKKLNNNTKGLPGDDDASDTEGNTGINAVSPIINGNAVHRVNGCDSQSSESASEESSPHPPSPTQTQDLPVSLAQELKEVDGGANSSGDDELVVVEVTSHQSGVVNHQVSVAHNVYSDSDSDEEYSEPAEISPVTGSPPTSNVNETVGVDECVDEAVVCGGGDLSHPGGLQMTPRQAAQASRYMYQGRSNVAPGSMATPYRRISQSAGGSGGDDDGGGGDRRSGGGGDGCIREDVNAQLVMVLQRLQTDMENVLHRLNTLETLTLSQHHSVCRHCQGGSVNVKGENGTDKERSWWPFPELSPRSTFFLLLWPVILHGGFRLLPLIRCRRKRS